MLFCSEPDNPGPLDNHTYEFITTEERVDVLVGKLNEATEIAIDLEHHDYRSYLGFTCLVQISINGHDYVIDPLSVGHCLHKLLDPFTNPSIIKVFILLVLIIVLYFLICRCCTEEIMIYKFYREISLCIL